MTSALLDPRQGRVAVIGAGLGGLATAIALQAGGVATTLIEAREEPGGRSGEVQRDGFTFCNGPPGITDRATLDDLWALAGTTIEHDVPLLPVTPLCRYSWPDGTTFDLAADPAEVTRAISRFAPGDLAGYEEYARIAGIALADFRSRPGPMPLAGPRDAAGLVPQLARSQAWRSLWAVIAGHVRDERLRQVLAVQALADGADPARVSAVTAADHARLRSGLWWPEGGFGNLARALLKRFAALGGTVRMGDPVCRIELFGNRAHRIETQSGWSERFDAIASSADRDHTWRDLLGGTPRGTEMGRTMRRRDHGPGLLTVHFALEGSWPGIPHNLVMFGPRFEALIEDIMVHGVLPHDQIIFLQHASLTDPALAPPGKSVLRAQVPVANLARLPIDWETVGPLLEQRVLAEVGRRFVPDLPDRLITSFHHSPRDMALDFNAAHGTAHGLAPAPLWRFDAVQPLRDKVIGNLYFAGAAATSGGGVTAALTASRSCARLIMENLA